MKNLLNKTFLIRYFKYLIFTLPILFFVGCDLDEEPPFLDETIYTDSQSAQAAKRWYISSIEQHITLKREDYLSLIYTLV